MYRTVEFIIDDPLNHEFGLCEEAKKSIERAFIRQEFAFYGRPFADYVAEKEAIEVEFTRIDDNQLRLTNG